MICQLHKDGLQTALLTDKAIYQDASIDPLAPVREEPILSPAQALAALQSGKSFEGAWFAQSVQGIEVRSCTLDYLSDSKGFYQPVYRFELSLAGQAGGITDAVDYVPALF